MTLNKKRNNQFYREKELSEREHLLLRMQRQQDSEAQDRSKRKCRTVIHF